MTRPQHTDSDHRSNAPPDSAVNDSLRAKKLRTPAAMAGRIDLRYTNAELEALEEYRND